MDYLHHLEKHGVSLTEYPLSKVLDSFPIYSEKHRAKKFISMELHPWVVSLQKALEGFAVQVGYVQVDLVYFLIFSSLCYAMFFPFEAVVLHHIYLTQLVGFT